MTLNISTKKAACAIFCACIVLLFSFGAVSSLSWADDSSDKETATTIASGTCGDDTQWSLNSEGLLSITGKGSTDSWEVTSTPWERYTKDIKSVSVEEGVEYVGSSAFSGCTSLESATIAKTVTYVGAGLFNGCSNLSTVTFPVDSSLVNIGKYMFKNTGLKAVVLPDSVKYIDEESFSSCADLKNVSLSKNLENLDSDAFNNTSLDCLYLAAEKNKEQISWLNSKPSTTKGKYLSESGVRYFFNNVDLFNNESLTITNYEGIVTQLDIPEKINEVQITALAENAFNSANLSSITILCQSLSIGDQAFANLPAGSTITTTSESVYNTLNENAQYISTDKTTVVYEPTLISGALIVARAYAEIDKPYAYGAIGPDAYDCSGLVSYCLTGEYGHAYTTWTLMECEQIDDPKPGDVCTNSYHCGIYIGDGLMIHAPRAGENVMISEVFDDMIYVRP